MIKRICVYCGSNSGAKKIYSEQAKELGSVLAREKIGLVYGGAGVGLMGAVADGILETGGKAIGVMPKFLVRKEVSHKKLTELKKVDSMHERKLVMAELADAFIALPGGLGTLEELFEILTWAQLGLHRKPCGLLNIDRYYDKLIEFLDHTVAERFLSSENRRTIIVENDIDVLLEKFAEYQPPKVEKWLDRART